MFNFNKPPLNKLNGIFKKEETAPKAPEAEMSQELHTNIPWRKYFLLLATAAITGESMAANISISPEKKKQNMEYMQSSPEAVKALEDELLKKAESLPMHSEGLAENGKEKTSRILPIDSNSAAYIEYVDGKPISISVREKMGEGRVIFGDGRYDEAMDGRVDHVTIHNKNGSTINYGFVEERNDKGETVVRITGISAGEGQGSTMLLNAQQGLEENLQKASDKNAVAMN